MRRSFLLLVIFVAALLLAASPVAATGTPTTGTRISLFAAPKTFPADTPFYIEHGSACDPSLGDQASGVWVQGRSVYNTLSASINFKK